MQQTQYCITKLGNVALEPHAARREAVQINTNIKEETDKHKELYFDLAAEKHKVDEEVRMLKMRVRHRERVINRMLPLLREHLTDEFILWEVIMREYE
jgi:hypothetical protein